MYNSLERYLLLILKTLNFKYINILSLVVAAIKRSLPHLSVESISIHKFKSGIKKSIMYCFIGTCVSYLYLQYLSKYSLNLISCGQSFFLKLSDNVLDIFSLIFGLKEGLLFFIRRLCILPNSEFSLLRPVAQCVWWSYFLKAASCLFINLRFNFFASFWKQSLLKPDLLLNSKIDKPYFQCSSEIILSNGILKNCSILSIALMAATIKMRLF